MLYVGVDAHKSTSQITVMNEAGVILRRKRVHSTSEGFKEAVAGYDEPFKAVLEASYSWGPMYDWLDDMSEEVLLAHPLKVRAIASARIKNDRIDSEVLAHLLRANLIPAAHAPSREIRALRRVLRQRMFFVQLRTMLRNRVRALLAQHSVKLPENESLYTKQGRVWLDQVTLPDSDAHLLHADCKLHDDIEVQVVSTDTLINKLAAQDSSVKWLISLPGIGRFLAVLILWETDDIHRFPDAKHFVSYTGLAPSTYASSSRLVHGSLTKQGNKWLRVGIHRSGDAGGAFVGLSPRPLHESEEPPRNKRRALFNSAKDCRNHLHSLERGTLLGGNTQLNLLQETPVALHNVLGIMAADKG